MSLDPVSGVSQPRNEEAAVYRYTAGTYLGHACHYGILTEEELDTLKVPTLSGEVQRLPSSLDRRCLSNKRQQY